MNFKIALVASALMAFAGALTVAGCGGDDCTAAADHVAECLPATSGGSGTTGSSTVECTGAVACQAKCTSAASCDTITGKDTKGLADYTKCLADCAGAK